MTNQSEKEENKITSDIPSTNIAMVPDSKSIVISKENEEPLISDDKLLNYYEEAIQGIKEDRNEANQRYLQLADMVVNEGDPSSSTKEAMVNCLKIKNDGIDQMIKILDLWTRLKMKDKSTSSQIYAYQQNKYEVEKLPNPNISQLIKLAQKMEKEDG